MTTLSILSLNTITKKSVTLTTPDRDRLHRFISCIKKQLKTLSVLSLYDKHLKFDKHSNLIIYIKNTRSRLSAEIYFVHNKMTTLSVLSLNTITKNVCDAPPLVVSSSLLLLHSSAPPLG